MNGKKIIKENFVHTKKSNKMRQNKTSFRKKEKEVKQEKPMSFFSPRSESAQE